MAPMPKVLDGNKQPYSTATKLHNGWVDTFAAIEGGYSVSEQEIAELVCQETKRLSQAHSEMRPLKWLLSPLQIEAALRSVKAGSAPGPDGVSADLLRAIGPAFILRLWILYLKSSLTMQAPIQYRGGYLSELYKGKGPHSDMNSYRSILLSDCVGKLACKANRVKCLPFAKTFLNDESAWQSSWS